ncbi:MAG: DUF4349 domain-containing protein [Clostridiales bacterium]|nr:DUF4349 domain-containing protein [Clostridiales bacterium]
MMKKQITNKWAVGLTAVLAMAMLCGCGAGADSAGNYKSEAPAAATEAAYDGLYEEYDYAEEELAVDETAESGEGAQAEQINDHGRKLIRTYTITAETKEFQKLIADVEKQVTALGGYIENCDMGAGSYGDDTHYANYVIRIPKDKAPGFVAHVEEASNVTQKTENVEDVTLSYVDLESHKKSLQTEQDRLFELLEQAETIEDIITIESRLSDVRYQLESMESQLRTYDNKIDYSTIHLNIREVEQITVPAKKTFIGRISEGLVENFRDVGEGLVDILVWFITGLPYWILLAVIVLLVIIIVKLCQKSAQKRRMKAWEKQQKQMAAAAAAAANENATQKSDAEEAK